MMKVQKLTPIVVVGSVEENLPFWERQLGYAIEAQVQHENKIGFVILKQGASEVMLQSKDSVLADLRFFGSADEIPPVLLYGEVESLEQVLAEIRDAQVLVKNRTTFYGAKETWVRTRDGHVLGFAEFKG